MQQNRRAYLTGRTPVPLRTGALLHLQRWLAAGRLGDGDVHPDVCNAAQTWMELTKTWTTAAFLLGFTTRPALGHVVHIGRPDHEDGHVGQSHQQVLPRARLSIGTPPCRLRTGGSVTVAVPPERPR